VAIPPEIRAAFSQADAASLAENALTAYEARLREQVVTNPEDPFPMHALGTVLFHLGNDREATALWANAAQRDPNLTPADVMLATHEVFRRLARDDPEGAARALRAAESRFEDQPHFQLIRAEQAVRSANLDAARSAFETAYQLDPELYVTAVNLARFYEVVAEQPDKIGALYEKAVRLAPDRAEGWELLGAFRVRQRQFDPALDAFRRAAKLQEDQPPAEQRIADLCLGQSDFDNAERWYRAALSADSTPEQRAHQQAALADVLLRRNELGEARTHLEAALRYSERADLLFALGTIDEAEHLEESAEARYRRVLALQPGNPLASNNLAMLLIRQARSADEALTLALSARNRLPDNATIEGTYGCALQSVGRHEEAIAVLGPVIAASATDAWAHYCRGSARAAEGDRDGATTDLSRAIELEPEFPYREEIETRLRALR